MLGLLCVCMGGLFELWYTAGRLWGGCCCWVGGGGCSCGGWGCGCCWGGGAIALGAGLGTLTGGWGTGAAIAGAAGGGWPATEAGAGGWLCAPFLFSQVPISKLGVLGVTIGGGTIDFFLVVSCGLAGWLAIDAQVNFLGAPPLEEDCCWPVDAAPDDGGAEDSTNPLDFDCCCCWGVSRCWFSNASPCIPCSTCLTPDDSSNLLDLEIQLK